MLANYHTHTKLCNHASGDEREYVENAIKRGIDVLGFSDHAPFIFDEDFVSPSRMLPQQTDEYFKILTGLKKEYEKDIKIYIGFESEYIPELMEKQEKFLADYPVEYMILGEHFTRSEVHSSYMGYASDSEEELIRYVDMIIEGVETGKYLYVAHPDLMNFTGDNNIYVREFTRLCRFLKSKDMPIEINMLGVSQKRNYTSERFMKIAAEIGNTAIIGADAHSPEKLLLGSEYDECVKLAEKFGIKLLESMKGFE